MENAHHLKSLLLLGTGDLDSRFRFCLILFSSAKLVFVFCLILFSSVKLVFVFD